MVHGLTDREREWLEYAALMHDIGQLSLPQPIPGGTTTILAAVDQRRGTVTVTATQVPGNYRVRSGGEAAGISRGFSANLAPEAIDARRLPDASLVAAFGEGARIARNEAELVRDVRLEVAIAIGLGGVPVRDLVEPHEDPGAVALGPRDRERRVRAFGMEERPRLEPGGVVAEDLDAHRAAQAMQTTHEADDEALRPIGAHGR